MQVVQRLRRQLGCFDWMKLGILRPPFSHKAFCNVSFMQKLALLFPDSCQPFLGPPLPLGSLGSSSKRKKPLTHKHLKLLPSHHLE